MEDIAASIDQLECVLAHGNGPSVSRFNRSRICVKDETCREYQ